MKRRMIALTGLFLLSLWLGFTSAGAQDEPDATTIELTTSPALSDTGKPVPGVYWIVATLTSADGGAYVANKTVQIVEPVQFIGSREASLGKAVTDSTGTAVVSYQPSQAGVHTIVARFGGDKLWAESETEISLDVVDVVSPYPSERLPLASVGSGLALFLAGLGIVFWTVLLGVLGLTVWRVYRAPGSTIQEEVASMDTRLKEG